jgi:RNA polymerase sigma-70 factor (ECF subfamily)
VTRSSLDDERVVAAVLAGDAELFEELVCRYQGGLYRYAISMVGDRDAAADMVQDAFVRAYVNLRTCRTPGSFRVWIFRTLRNRCFDHLRASRRKSLPLDEASDLADRAEGPAARVERRETQTEIRLALDRLPEQQREAFLMHYVEGVPYEEMAALLGTSVSALKMRALRARDALATVLGDPREADAPSARVSARR